MPHLRCSAAFAMGLLLAACGDPIYGPFIQKPTTEMEKSLGCSEIDRAIDRADTVRWMIRVRHGSPEHIRAASERRAAGLPIVPASITALTASDQRIRELLQIKRAHGCVARMTALPALDDLQLLTELESLQAKADAKSRNETALLKERTRLLDGLRVVPPPAATLPRQSTSPADK